MPSRRSWSQATFFADCRADRDQRQTFTLNWTAETKDGGLPIWFGREPEFKAAQGYVFTDGKQLHAAVYVPGEIDSVVVATFDQSPVGLRRAKEAVETALASVAEHGALSQKAA